MAKHICYANSLTSVTNITTTTDAAVFTVPYACKCNSPQTFFVQFPTLMGTLTTSQLAYLNTCNKTYQIVDSTFTQVPGSIFTNNSVWLLARVCRNNTRYYQLVNYTYTAPAAATTTSTITPSTEESSTSSTTEGE